MLIYLQGDLMRQVIGLLGAKGSGKTTAFQVISGTWDVQEITLAGKLKSVSAEVFGIPRDHFDSHDFKEKELENPAFLSKDNLTQIYKAYDFAIDFDKDIRPHIGTYLESPRKIAQYIGSEILRAKQSDVHCTSSVKDITKPVGIVTDIRFPNEYDFFKNQYPDFHFVYIQNMGAESHAGKDSHVSEKYLKDLIKRADAVLTNNDGIDSFRSKVTAYFKEIL